MYHKRSALFGFELTGEQLKPRVEKEDFFTDVELLASNPVVMPPFDLFLVDRSIVIGLQPKFFQFI